MGTARILNDPAREHRWEFRILGPLEVLHADQELALSTPRMRALLAVLLVRARQVVTIEQLVDELWPSGTQANARSIIHAYVSRLRRALRDVAQAGDDEGLLVTRTPGYQLRIDPDQLDAHRFDQLVERARTARQAGDAQQCAAVLGQALTLWRGSPLADVPPTPTLGAEAARLSQARLATLEELYDAKLATGHGGELVAELATLVNQNPLRERLRALLMLALYRSGRQAEALQVFHDTRDLLIEQLGIEPGSELHEIQRQILAHDPKLRPAAPTQIVAATARRSNRRNDLPGDVADFTGRENEMRVLLAHLPADNGARTVTISAIDGMTGIGKTALAVHAAHQLADRYPDVQLFIDLQAHTVGRQPFDPHTALAALLEALGVPAPEIPEELDQRAAMWRAELAGCRALIVLDNAASASQVRPLLPGTAGCLALVTSRHRLTDLDTAVTLSLDLLSPGEATDLFTQVVGAERAQASPDAVAEVVQLCGYLPLAVRIAAARLRSRPAWTVRDLGLRLRDEQHRLTELAAGDRSVAGAFMLSYQHLSPAQQRLFRLLGLHPGTDIDAFAAAALGALTLDAAERTLEDLVDAHLLQEPALGKYRFHDLLRHFAHDIARRGEPEPDRREALTRLLDYYLHGASLAAAHLDPRGRQVSIDPTFPPAHPPLLDTYADALAWCEAEQANLISLITYAADHGWYTHAWRLPNLLWQFLRMRGRHRESLYFHQLALTAARHLDDRDAEAHTLRNLGINHERLGHYTEALDHHRQALALYRQIGDRWGEGATLANLGVVSERLGDYPQAIRHYQQSLTLRREVGDLWGQGATLNYLGLVLDRLGRYTEALDHYRQALTLRREVGDQRGEGATLTCAGMTYERLERYAEAAAHHKQALALMRTTGDKQGEGAALGNLGNVYRRMARYDEALAHHQQTLTAMREVGDRNSESEVLNDLGETYLAMGQIDDALGQHRHALALARDVHVRPQEARAHDGIAHALNSTDPDAARQHWLQALDIYRALGVPEADQVRRYLETSAATIATAASTS